MNVCSLIKASCTTSYCADSDVVMLELFHHEQGNIVTPAPLWFPECSTSLSFTAFRTASFLLCWIYRCHQSAVDTPGTEFMTNPSVWEPLHFLIPPRSPPAGATHGSNLPLQLHLVTAVVQETFLQMNERERKKSNSPPTYFSLHAVPLWSSGWCLRSVCFLSAVRWL